MGYSERDPPLHRHPNPLTYQDRLLPALGSWQQGLIYVASQLVPTESNSTHTEAQDSYEACLEYTLTSENELGSVIGGGVWLFDTPAITGTGYQICMTPSKYYTSFLM